MIPANTHSNPGTKSVHQARWEENLAGLARFLDDNDRFPSQTATAPSERKLAWWLRTQRSAARDDRIEVLDRMIPDWRSTTCEARWEAQAEAVASFAAAHGRHPRSGSSNRGEQLLGYWLVQQRRSATPERAALLDSRIPAWRESNRPVWSETLAKVSAFVAEHGHIPHQTGTSNFERSLAHWLKAQRQSATQEHAAALDSAVPAWRGNHPGHRSWEDSLAAVQEFLTENGRLPARGADESQRRLALWVYDQSRRATDVQRAALDRALPGWEPTPVSWAERHADVLAFRATNGRLPEPTDTGDVRALGVWLDNQRQIATEDARSILDSSLPGWHVSLEDRWNTRLAELSGHIAKHGRLPRQASADTTEKALSRWLYKQRRHAAQARIERLDASAPGWRGRAGAA